MIEILEPADARARPGPDAPLPRAPWSGAAAARNMFGLDYRSLALLRVAMGLCLLWVVYTNAIEMRAFYTDDGVLPREALIENPGDFLGFSLHLAGGGMPYIATLFVVQFVLAAMMTAGYRTRLATIGSYVMLLSMQNRNPVLLFGADIALRVGLFWMIFLPLANRFSLDSLAGRTRAPPNRPYLAVAGIAFILQVCLIYSAGALLKTGHTWTIDHTAVARALSLDVYSRPLGHWLSRFDGLTRVLTVVTLYLELYGPLLFVLPVFSSWCRSIGILLFAALQIGFGLCMTMGVFGPVMIALTLAFLPAVFWERVGEPAGKWLAAKMAGLSRLGAVGPGLRARHWLARERVRSALKFPWTDSRIFKRICFVLGLARDGAVALLAAVMILWNIGNIPGQRWRLNSRLDSLGYNLGINQTWDMFSPDPQATDGWFVVEGKLRNGQTVDLLSGASPVSFERPASITDAYRSQLWMSWLISYWDDGAYSPEYLTRYFGRQWNAGHTGNEKLESIAFYAMDESGNSDESSAAEPEVLWTQWY